MRPWPADQPPREDTRPTGTSRPLAGGASTVPPMREIARPVLSLNRFGSANGLTLKFRFLLALTLLALAPACLLVLLYQQANQNTLTQAGQKSLAAAAQTNSHTLTQVLANHQAQLARLAQQSSIAQVSQGNGDTQQAETLLQTAGLSTGDALAGMVLNRSDQIVAALPASLEGQRLASSTVLADSGALERFVHAQRSAPMPKVGQSALPVASGTDAALAARAWVATIAFVSPAAPAHSGVVLAIYSLPAMVKSYLSALPSVSNSYASVFATTGTLLGVVGNQALAQQIGQTLAIAPLQHAIHATQATPTSSALIYDDPTTNTQETAAGFFNKDLEMAFLVTAPPGALAPAITGLLQGRNLPLIFLIIFVITSLVATWVALPIVRPIRRATREILASTDDVRVLALQAKQIAKDQRLGTDILEGAAKGLDMRRRAIGRDAGLIANSSTVAATRLAQIAHTTNELPDAFQTPMQMLVRELYQELQTVHQLATSISTGLESDPVQKRLGNVMEGAAEISQQFDDASKQLERGASRLERAARALQ